MRVKISLLVFLMSVQVLLASKWYPYPVEVWDPPFYMDSPRKSMDYIPLAKASKPWEICVSFPHMKDAVWLGMNYGVVDEAKRMGVKLQVVEAGGYTELNRQISQIEDCVAAGAKAVIIGAISGDGLNNLVVELRSKGIVVIDAFNGMSSRKVSAKSVVSFKDMGVKAGEFLAKKHPKGSKKVKVVWFPGPAGAGWVETGNNGFMEAVDGSAVEVLDTKYGDTGKEVQSKLVEDALQTYKDLDYIAGTAVTAEAAIPILRSRGLSKKIKIVSYYYSPGVDQAIKRGQVLVAPTDSPIIQARIAIDQSVRILEGKDYLKHVGPAIITVTKDNYKKFDSTVVLAPKNFKATFRVK